MSALQTLRALGRGFVADEAGQGVVEYGLLIGLMVVVSIASLTALGTDFNTFFFSVSNQLESALGTIS